MKMLVHRIAHGTALPFNLLDLKAHIRVDTDADDPTIIGMGETAAAEIEQFAQIALLTQTIRVTIFDPTLEGGFKLPIGPAADDSLTNVTIDGEAFAAFEFLGGNRPYIRWLASYHGLRPSRITIVYQAGFGTSASHIPPDLAQALMDQAALHYGGRSPMDARSLTTSPHMSRVGALSRGAGMTDRELDEVLTFRWPIVLRSVMASNADDWLKGFVRSIAMHGKRPAWRPTEKQELIMQRLLSDLGTDRGCDGQLIDHCDGELIES